MDADQHGRPEQPEPGEEPFLGFAPADPSDGRDFSDEDGQRTLTWASRYPPEAWKLIRSEATVLLLFFFGALSFGALAHVQHPWLDFLLVADVNPAPRDLALLALGGLLGGTLFTMKWLYHSVARGLWHTDRRLWRIFVPLISAATALSFGFLMAGDVVSIFRSDVLRGGNAWGLGFLIGYFSDSAIAKLAEVANTLFGTSEKHATGGHVQDGRPAQSYESNSNDS